MKIKLRHMEKTNVGLFLATAANKARLDSTTQVLMGIKALTNDPPKFRQKGMYMGHVSTCDTHFMYHSLITSTSTLHVILTRSIYSSPISPLYMPSPSSTLLLFCLHTHASPCLHTHASPGLSTSLHLACPLLLSFYSPPPARLSFSSYLGVHRLPHNSGAGLQEQRGPTFLWHTTAQKRSRFTGTIMRDGNNNGTEDRLQVNWLCKK